jgi:hypothetical protein
MSGFVLAYGAWHGAWCGLSLGRTAVLAAPTKMVVETL